MPCSKDCFSLPPFNSTFIFAILSLYCASQKYTEIYFKITMKIT